MENDLATRRKRRKGPVVNAPLGSGARFAALKAQISERGGVRNPAAVAASIGRRKYGARRMAKMAAAGRKRG